MRRLSAALSLLLVLGCGPMNMPMVQRPDLETQTRIDLGWNQALSPVDRLNRQEMLDTLVGAGIFQYGVDRLDFRSEKRLATGVVVMEIHYERNQPDNDRFEVTVLNHLGDVLRREHYKREDVETTCKDLFNPPPKAPPVGKVEPLEDTRRRADYEARWQRIKDLFPERAKEKQPGASSD